MLRFNYTVVFKCFRVKLDHKPIEMFGSKDEL